MSFPVISRAKCGPLQNKQGYLLEGNPTIDILTNCILVMQCTKVIIPVVPCHATHGHRHKVSERNEYNSNDSIQLAAFACIHRKGLNSSEQSVGRLNDKLAQPTRLTAN